MTDAELEEELDKMLADAEWGDLDSGSYVPALVAEVRRLREALEKIASYDECEPGGHAPLSDCVCCMAKAAIRSRK